jgi:hypothetical protein
MNEQDRADMLLDLTELETQERVYEEITDGQQLQALIDDMEVNLGAELARIFRNLDRAAKQRYEPVEKQYALDAILQAAFAIRKKCEDAARKGVA